MMKIGVLSWDYKKPKGGIGYAFQRVVSALQSDGMDVRVMAPSNERPLLAFTKKWGGHLLFSFALPFVLHRRMSKEDISGLVLPVGPGGVFLLRRPFIPAFAIVYHTYLQQYQQVPGQRWKRIFCLFERRTLSACQTIVCYSEDTKRALIEGYHIDEQRIHLLSFPVDVPPASAIQREEFFCICVARLEARKGVDVLLRAWPTIIKQIPQARLVVVGDGIQRTMIDRLISQTTSVERRSGISYADMQELLARASVAFCPAYLEGFGCACSEAMAAGCCVIASDADSLRRLIRQSETGLLVPAGDSEALAAATIGVLSQSDRSRIIGNNARASMIVGHDPVAADRALCAAVRSAFAR